MDPRSRSRRRALALAALAPALALQRYAVAQERVARVGMLSWQDRGDYHVATRAGFVDGLAAEGYVVGRNLALFERSASNDPRRFKPLARELADEQVDLFFAPATPMAAAAWSAARTTPIIIATILDPVELEFVQSLARPGTRVTGVTTMNDTLMVKRLSLLGEVVPNLKRVGVVIDEAMRDACKQEIEHTESAARKLGLELVVVHADRPESLNTAVRKLVEARVQAVTTTLLSTRNGLEQEYAAAALRHKLASMHEQEAGVRAGGLLSYGPDFVDVYRRAGRAAGRVLKGAAPATLPMEEPREFRLVVNLATARALGTEIPPAVLLRADEVIR